MIEGWYAGTAEANITPPVGREMCGYASRRFATGVRDPIYLRGLILAHGGSRLAILTADLLAIDDETVTAIRDALEERCGLARQMVLVAASHNHTGPASGSLFEAGADRPWLEGFVASCVQVVEESLKHLEPASLRVGWGDEASFSFNRRLLDPLGQVTTPLDVEGGLDPSTYRPEGPVDTSVGVLRVDVDGQCRALVVNYANHPDIPTGTHWSADYPGQMAWAVRRLMGAQVVPLFLNGACGDVEHLNAFDPEDLGTRDRYRDRAGEQKLIRYGTSLGAEVVRAALAAAPMRSDALDSRTCVVPIPVREIDETVRASAHAVLVDDRSSERDRAFAREALRVAAMPAIRDVEVSVVVIGELAIATNPTEMFAALGLRIKSSSPFAHTFISELSNGYAGYLPTPEAFLHGGYEVRPTRGSHLHPQAATTIVARTVELLHEMHAAEQYRDNKDASHVR